LGTITLSVVIAAGLVISSLLVYSAISAGYPLWSTISQQPRMETLAQRGSSNTASLGAFAQEQNLTLSGLYERVGKSVVQITSTNSDPSLSDSSLGSGFVYDSGYIITNNHVVTKGNALAVTISDGTIYNAKLIGSDPYTDLAVLSVNAPKDKLVPIPMADSTKLRVGEQVVAIGNPFGLSGSMTAGIVSGLGRLLPTDLTNLGDGSGSVFSIPDIIQTDTSVNPGNSGGPLLNIKGEVVGITTAIYSRTGEFSGIGFAIPSNAIVKVVPSLIKSGSFNHSWLGISGTNMTPGIAKAVGLEEPRGFLVTGTEPDSPASKVGIKGGVKEMQIDGKRISLGGDVIIKIDGKEVRKIEDILVYLQREKSAGDSVKLTILRDGEVLDVNIQLGTRPVSTNPR